MIHIDYQGGAHGNFLEFVCNTVAGVVVPGTLPFNKLGAAHNKSYRLPKVFFASHYSYDDTHPKLFNKIISIQIDPDDLLPLNQVSLLRAGDHGHDNDHLEVDTFNKLNNINYRWMLDQLTDGFFTNQIRCSYDAVKDPSWPDATSLDEFNQLPEHIRTECIQQHGLVLLELSEKNPDCPRFVLREFFKIGFQNPSQNGFIARQKNAVYDVSNEVYIFPFRSFYNKTEFLSEIKKVAAWSGMTYDCENKIELMHDEFLARQLYKDSKHKCDDIVQKRNHNVPLGTLKITLLEEAYVNAALGWDYFH